MTEQTNLVTHYFVAFITALTGLTINEWVAIGGFLLGVATFFLNWYYKKQNLALAMRKANFTLKTKPEKENNNGSNYQS